MLNATAPQEPIKQQTTTTTTTTNEAKASSSSSRYVDVFEAAEKGDLIYVLEKINDGKDCDACDVQKKTILRRVIESLIDQSIQSLLILF